jgi:hypothetical protein
MIKKYYFIALLLAILNYSCDDNPTIVENKTEPTSSNISFVPDTLYISENINENTVQFEGVDFVRFMPDSVRLDNHKVDIIISDRAKLIVQIPFKYIGTFAINIFFKSGLITLDSSITLINNSTSEPTADNIYFEPDTLKIYHANSPFYITLRGMNFNNIVDSVVVGGKKCLVTGDKSIIGYQVFDSITANIPKWVYGNLEVVVYLKGKKIVLSKKLVVINPSIDFDFTQLNKITWEIRYVPTYREQIVRVRNNKGGYDISKTFDTTEFNYIRRVSSENINVYFNPPAIYFSSTGMYVSPIGFAYEIDTLKGYLRSFSWYTYNQFLYNGYQKVQEKYGFNIVNIPYKINYLPDNKIELEIKISGKEIDNYFAFVNFTYSNTTESNYYSTFINTISKKDPNTGSDINFFPATDSSLIVIHLRNFSK